jgi:hypothetical protein
MRLLALQTRVWSSRRLQGFRARGLISQKNPCLALNQERQ